MWPEQCSEKQLPHLVINEWRATYLTHSAPMPAMTDFFSV